MTSRRYASIRLTPFHQKLKVTRCQLEQNRLWSVPGNTFIINEPSQFLDHYYHFCAEWLFGAWAFWQGAFNADVKPSSPHKTDAPSLAAALQTLSSTDLHCDSLLRTEQ